MTTALYNQPATALSGSFPVSLCLILLLSGLLGFSVPGQCQGVEINGDFDTDGIAGPRDLQQLIEAFGQPVAAGTGNLIWAKRAFGLSFKGANGAAIQDDGVIVVNGQLSNGTTFGEGELTQAIVNTSGFQAYVATYMPDGGFVRVRSTTSSGGSGITINPADNSAWSTGQFTGTATFGIGGMTQTMITSGGSADIYLSRQDVDGELTFARPAGGPGFQDGFGVDVLPDGTSVQIGVMDQAATFGIGNVTLTLTALSTRNICLVKNNPDGTPAWGKGINTTVFDSGMDAVLLPDGDVLTCSNFENSLVFGEGEIGEMTLESTDNSSGFASDDAFLVRYNSDGSLDWAIREGGPGDDRAVAIAVLPGDDGLVVGGTFDENIRFGEGTPDERLLIAEGGRDIFVARYDLDGFYQWARGASGPGSQNLTSIDETPDGGVVIGGSFQQSVIFGAGEPNETTLVSDGGTDGFIAKYTGAGALLWARQVGGLGDDIVRAVAVHSDGTFVAVGSFTQTATFGRDEANQIDLESGGNTPSVTSIFVAKFAP